MENDLFNLEIADDKKCELEFKKKNVVFTEDIKYFSPDFFEQVKNKNIYIKGRSPIEMYVYLCYWCVKNNCNSISINDYNLSMWFEIYSKTKAVAKSYPKWCSIKGNQNYTVLQIESSLKSLDGKWSAEEICAESSCFEIDFKSEPIILTGRGSLLFYSILACSSAVSNFKNILLNKPTEQNFLKIAGNLFIEKKNQKIGRMIGVLGDPNSGKSMFSKVFGCLIDFYSYQNDTWVYDCDAAALTSDWYIYGLQTAESQKRIDEIKTARDKIKQNWTPELELKVAENMSVIKSNLNFIIADLPGGRHKEEENIHERIPDSERAEMLKNCDGFIIIGRQDKPELIDDWINALQQYNLQDRVIAHILSGKPENAPSAKNVFFDENNIFHASVYGLDRKNKIEDIAVSLKNPFKSFIDTLKLE